MNRVQNKSRIEEHSAILSLSLVLVWAIGRGSKKRKDSIEKD